MSDVLEKLRSRGMWTIRIRPVEFQDKRVDRFSALEDAVRNSRVELRGWYFPHLDDKNPPVVTKDYIGQEIDWEHYVELWRAYKSGQFISVSGFPEDWRDQSKRWPSYPEWKPGSVLGFEGTVFRFVEVFEFAARWANAIPMGDEMFVEVTLRGLEGRSLAPSPRRQFASDYICSEKEFKWEQQYATAQLFSAPRDSAVAPVIELFELFRLDITESAVRDIQNELRS